MASYNIHVIKGHRSWRLSKYYCTGTLLVPSPVDCFHPLCITCTKCARCYAPIAACFTYSDKPSNNHFSYFRSIIAEVLSSRKFLTFFKLLMRDFKSWDGIMLMGGLKCRIILGVAWGMFWLLLFFFFSLGRLWWKRTCVSCSQQLLNYRKGIYHFIFPRWPHDARPTRRYGYWVLSTGLNQSSGSKQGMELRSSWQTGFFYKAA